MTLKGKAWTFGSNVDTDGIIAGRYCATQDPVELGKHVMEDIAPDFQRDVRAGDVIVGGSNFGCGSSREQAPMAIRGAGVSCVIAESFARIFFRNAINIGLPILESPEAARGIQEGDEVEIDLEKGQIRDLTRDTVYPSAVYPAHIREIIAQGGLLSAIRLKMGTGKTA